MFRWLFRRNDKTMTLDKVRPGHWIVLKEAAEGTQREDNTAVLLPAGTKLWVLEHRDGYTTCGYPEKQGIRIFNGILCRVKVLHD